MREGQASAVMDGFSQGWSCARERSWNLTLPLSGKLQKVSGKPMSYFWLNFVGNIVLKGENLQRYLVTRFKEVDLPSSVAYRVI